MFVTPDWSYVPQLLAKMLETIEMTVLGTAIAVVVSLPLGILAARNATPHPVLDEAALGALFAPAGERTPEQAARVALDDALIAEIQAADSVVLGVPMYNFGVPAPLKNWIDAISRAGVTFRYTEKGPEGLLKGKKVYVVLARGGKYRDTPADTQVAYLKMVLTFLGLTDLHFIYAEGLAMGADAEHEAIASAHEQIEDAVAA